MRSYRHDTEMTFFSLLNNDLFGTVPEIAHISAKIQPFDLGVVLF